MESSSPSTNVDLNPEPYYPWYQILQNPEKIQNFDSNPKYKEYLERYTVLEQGDFLFDFSYFKPKTFDGTEIDGESIEYDLIILSQSCDLINGKIESVLVAPIWNFPEIEKINDWYKAKEAKEAVRRGHQPNYHLLNQCDLEPFKNDCCIVDFKNTFAVPFDQVINYIKGVNCRLRLLSPYKEHLSQAFARFFMRVGLPIDIKPFASKVKINYDNK